MRVLILGNKETAAYKESAKLVSEKGHTIVEAREAADVAVAPLPMDILPPGHIYAPKSVTLIFHPSPSPSGRGASSIKWASRRTGPLTEGTWFWANLSKRDSGQIIGQEGIKNVH